jgi:DAK2 domain fusion protein YloV
MGFLFFKTAKEKERAERRERRHALRKAEGAVDEVTERIRKMEKDAEAEWARAKDAAKEGKQAAAQRALTSYRSAQVLITKLEQKKWVFKQVLMKLETAGTDAEFAKALGMMNKVTNINPELVEDVFDEANELLAEEMSYVDYFEAILKEGDETLARTPELLPVLKEAGVVDSGGQGLMVVLHGAVDAYNGLEIDLTFEAPKTEVRQVRQPISTDDIKFGYCTEFIVKLEKEIYEEDEEAMKEYLLSLGDSLVFVAGDGMIKVHVHTNHPGKAFEKGLEYGQLTRMKVDNMREEHEERLFNSEQVAAARAKEIEKEEKAKAKNEPKKPCAFISVSAGDGLSELFKELGVDVVITGGQTMNPSTDDMLEAIKVANAENVFIFPNNKNIILTANQARDITEDCKVFVIPTKTIPQGISAVIGFVPEKSPEDNAADMTECATAVKSCEITYAVRDTQIDGVKISNGDIMAIGDDGILAVGPSIKEVVIESLKKLVDDDSELISIYNGQDFPEDETEILASEVEELWPDTEVEVNYGGQPVYYLILSVE